jgi:hypothetical protein
MDKEKGSWRESVDGALAKTSSAPAETQFGTVTPDKLAAPSASLADEVTAAAGCRPDGDGEAFRRAAQLATWEGEGGTASVESKRPCEETDRRSDGSKGG